MRRNVYNVLWVDDEISNILNPFTRELLENEGINLVDTATHASGPNGLEGLLTKYVNADNSLLHIDAVITDANFNAKTGVPNEKSERDTSGLNMVTRLMSKYSERNILFYLYTGRDKSMLLDIYGGGELDVFQDNGRWFQKTLGPAALIEAIKRDIDNLNSTEFQIRNNYRAEFEAAAIIPGASELLLNGLQLKTGKQSELASMFNKARMVFEQIRDLLRKRGFIPDMKSLNDVPRFFSGKDVEPYKPIGRAGDIMPHALCRSLSFFLDIVQDGSHNTDKVNLGVIDYVQQSNSANLFYSILHILMDILKWYANIPDDNTLKNQWTGCYLEVSIVSLSQSGLFHTQSGCQLEPTDDLKKGVCVGVKSQIPNKHKTTGLMYFAWSTDYDIMDRKDACLSNVAQ